MGSITGRARWLARVRARASALEGRAGGGQQLRLMLDGLWKRLAEVAAGSGVSFE
jgi:hypothetical protein